MQRTGLLALLAATVAAGIAIFAALPSGMAIVFSVLSFATFCLTGLSVQLKSMRTDDFEIKSSPQLIAMAFSGALSVGALIGVAVVVTA
jgi:hypothetical protein